MKRSISALLTFGICVAIIAAGMRSPSPSGAATSCNTPWQVNSTAYFDTGNTIIGSASMPCTGQTHRVCIQRWTTSGWSPGFDCANDRAGGWTDYLSAATHTEVCGAPYRTVSKYGSEPVQVSSNKVPCRSSATVHVP